MATPGVESPGEGIDVTMHFSEDEREHLRRLAQATGIVDSEQSMVRRVLRQAVFDSHTWIINNQCVDEEIQSLTPQQQRIFDRKDIVGPNRFPRLVVPRNGNVPKP